MTELRTRRVRWLLGLLLWTPACMAAPGSGLASGYLEAAYANEGDTVDGGESEGGAIGLRLPISGNWFFTASAQTLGGYADSFGDQHVDEERRSAGIGVRRGRPHDEVYARLVYTDITDWRSGSGTQEARGGALSVGVRSIGIASILEGTLEGGLGGLKGSEGEGRLTFAARGELALRLGQSLSAYVALVVEERAFGHAGLRFNFSHYGRPQPVAAVRAAGPDSAQLLAAGQSVVVKRALQLQVRPAFGAPETVVVPAGETLALAHSLRNDFGNWWRVSWNGQEGWIREGWLLRAE